MTCTMQCAYTTYFVRSEIKINWKCVPSTTTTVTVTVTDQQSMTYIHVCTYIHVVHTTVHECTYYTYMMTVNSCGIVICVCGLCLWFSTHDIHDMYDGTIYHSYPVQLEVPTIFQIIETMHPIQFFFIRSWFPLPHLFQTMQCCASSNNCLRFP